MSKIIKSRGLIVEAILRAKDLQRATAEILDLLENSLKYMFREPPIRRARAHKTVVTPELRDAVRKLARRYPNMTTQDIAVKVGLRNAGRVSEILRNRR